MCNLSKLVILAKNSFIFAFIFGSLALNGTFVQAAAVTASAVSSNGGNKEVIFCESATSQVNLLELKPDDDVCSKESQKAVSKKIKVILTAYSSTVAQTDSTPFITANGTYVHDGVVANNGLPFGTEIRIPELYGNKVFAIEDRMHWRKSDYHFDIWFPTYEQAKNFGVRYAYVEVLKK